MADLASFTTSFYFFPPQIFKGKFQMGILLYKSVFLCYLQSSFTTGSHLIISHLWHVSPYPISQLSLPFWFHCTRPSMTKAFPKSCHAQKQFFPPAFHTSTQSLSFDLFWLIPLFSLPLGHKLVKGRELVLLITGSKITPLYNFGFFRVLSFLSECYKTHVLDFRKCVSLIFQSGHWSKGSHTPPRLYNRVKPKLNA